MREISINNVKQIWNDNLSKIDKFNLFMDNPFCVKICNYCYFNSTQAQMHSDLYNKYYYDYLPRQIDEFADILSRRVPDTVYFGGGTPNLMTPKIMKDIFNRIPNFRKIVGKHIENHPLFLRDEHLELYKEYDFKFVSLGIQTLNKDILNKENRLITPIEKLEHIMDKTRELDLVTNMDLLVFLSDKDLDTDMNVLKNDLEILLGHLKPSIITIYPKYGNLTDEKIKKLQRTLLQTLRKHQDYIMHPRLSTIELPDNLDACYFLTRLSDEDFVYHKSYDCTGLPLGNPNQNVLAIGGYGKRRVFNYLKVDNDLSKRFEYYTYNENWNYKFYVEE